MSEIDCIKHYPIANYWNDKGEGVIGRTLYLILEEYGSGDSDNSSSPGDIWVGGGSGEGSCSVMDGVNAALETINHIIELTFENEHPHSEEIRSAIENEFHMEFDEFYNELYCGEFVELQMENEIIYSPLNYGRFNYYGDEWSEIISEAKDNGYNNDYNYIEEFIACETGRYVLERYEKICNVLPSFDLFKYGSGDKAYDDFLNLVLANRLEWLDY